MIDIQRIEQKYNSKVLCILQTGSKLFDCPNFKDDDVVVLLDTSEIFRRYEKRGQSDCFIYGKDYFERCGRFEVTESSSLQSGLTLQRCLELPNYIKYLNSDLSYDFKKYEDGALESLKRYLEIECIEREFCPKWGYWAFAMYFLLRDGSAAFGKEELEMIWKCHDRKLPMAYLEELKRIVEGGLDGICS